MNKALAEKAAWERELPDAAAERSDSELLQDYRDIRSERAFDAIVARHGSMVYRTCLRTTGNPHEAEDAAQATFIVLARRPDAVRRSLATWLYWVARNTAFKVVRSRLRRNRHEQAAGHMRTETAPTAADAHLREELDRALQGLPDRLRETVILRYLEGRGQEESARILGCPMGTVARRSMDGLHRLRNILQRRGIVVTGAALAAFLYQEASALGAATLWPVKLATALHATSGVPATLAGSVLQSLFWTKVKVVTLSAAIAASVCLLSAGVAVRFVYRQALAPVIVDKEPAHRPMAVCLIQPKPNEKLYCPADDVAMSQSGQLVASGRCDGSTWIYDVATAQPVSVLEGHRSRVRPVLFTPDGHTLATGSYDCTVKIWDVAGGEVRHTLAGHSGWIFGLAFSPDGKALASASWDKTVKLWDAETGEELFTLVGHTNSVHSVAFAPNRPIVATGSSDGTVRLWHRETGREAATLGTGMGDVMGVAYSPDGRFLAATSMARGIFVWDTDSGEEVLRITAARATGLAFSPRGDALALAGGEGVASLWSIPDGRRIGEVRTNSSYAVAFDAGGERLAIAGNGRVTLVELGAFREPN